MRAAPQEVVPVDALQIAMRRVLVIFLLLAVGAGMAFGLSGALRLSWVPARVMAEPSGVAPARPAVPAEVGSVSLSRRSHRLEVAARAVTDAGRGARGVLRVVV